MDEGYVLIGNDWPAQIPSPDLSSEKISRALNGFDRIYDRAMEDLGNTPLPRD